MPETRRPHRLHEGRKGFSEVFEPRTAAEKDLEMLDKHRTAQRVLLQNGSFFPTPQQLLEMSNEQNKLDELQRVKERIKALEKGHSDDLERLYISQGRDYLQEALDRYMSKDDTQYLVKGENNLDAKESYGRLDNLYKGSRKAHAYASEWDDAVDRLRVEYLKQILPLQRRRAGLEPQGEAFLQGDDQFPASHQEYYAIRNKDTQARIARFLKADTQRQETLMNWYGWTVHQVQPLRYEYQTNSEFMADINEKVNEFEAQDPGRRPSLA